MSIVLSKARHRVKRLEKQPREYPFGHSLRPKAPWGPNDGTLPQSTLLYKPLMAPPKNRRDSRSGSPKGGRFGSGSGKPGKPHSGKPHSGKPHSGKPGPGKPHSRNAGPGHPGAAKGGAPKGARHGRPPGKPACAKETLNRAPGKHAERHDKPNRAPDRHPRPEHAKDKHSRPAGKPGYVKHARPAGKPYNPGPDTRPQRPERGDRPAKQENWLYGLHAVQAALANPRRKLGRVVVTTRVLGIIDPELLDGMKVETMELGAIDRLLPPGAVHQGAALEAAPLPQVDLDNLLAAPCDGRRRVVLVLDQLSDPHNVGAILRSAAAFGVTAVVVQDRHAPPQSGALAKAASGALDTIPYVEVVNITRALEKLAELGFWRIALAGDGDQTLAAAIPDGDVALVMGSEGDGIRRLVRENCDVAASIPIEGVMESLNVSNAAAIALYELRRSR